jgi:hypothetical protein
MAESEDRGGTLLILDKGICSVFSAANGAAAGSMPADKLTLKYQSWYGELSFETVPARPTDYREDAETSSRIRILQNRDVTNRDAVIFTAEKTPAEDAERYEITRAYHGVDDESGELITDLTLERVIV